MQVKLTPLGGPDGRLQPRRLVRLRARFEDQGAGMIEAVVTDLSEKGCRLEGGDLGEGGQLRIRLRGLGARACRIVWVDRREAGCEFETPLYRAEHELVRGQSGTSNKVRTGVFGRSNLGPGRLS